MNSSARRWILTGVGVAVLVILVALYSSREALLFGWKLKQLARWKDGGYVSNTISRTLLPEEIVNLERWFVDQGMRVVPRLRAELASPELARKITALELLEKIEGRPPPDRRLEPFWHAFEDRDRVERFARVPRDVIVTSLTGGVHGGAGWGVLLAESGAEHTVIWRAEPHLVGDRRVVIIRNVALRGEARQDFLRGLARHLFRPRIDLIEGVEPPGTRGFACRFFVSDSAGGGLFVSQGGIQLSGWSWIDEAAVNAMEIASRPDDTEAQPFEIEAVVGFLLRVLEQGPVEAAECVALAFQDLALPLELREQVRARLEKASTAQPPGANAVASALRYVVERADPGAK